MVKQCDNERVTISMCLIAGILASAATALAQPQQPQKQTLSTGVSNLYQQMLNGIRAAKTKDDLVKMLDASDTSDWVSIDPSGKRSSREDAQKALETLLKTPPEKRIVPDLEVVWMQEAGGKAIVLMWVTARAKITDHQGQLGDKGKSHDTTIGALVRDSLIMTPKGWRRSMHEKILPDQPLSIDGAPRIHIPGTPPIPAPKH